MMGGLKTKAGNSSCFETSFHVATVLCFTCCRLRSHPSATFDESTKVFRLDGGNVTYVFGVNARGELQQLYWGGRLGAADHVPQAVPAREWASFDSSYTNTPQEYAGWGAGLFVEPALKVTFADGNRDLVLHYEQPRDRHRMDSMLSLKTSNERFS